MQAKQKYSTLTTSIFLQGYDYDYYDHLRDAKMISSSLVNLTTSNSTEADNSTSIIVTTLPPLTIVNATADNSTAKEMTLKNFTYVDQDKLKLPPEIRTNFLGIMDTIFVWLRYIHFTIVPIIIFVIHKVFSQVTRKFCMYCKILL